jgi:CDP-diacylglycerol--serine O-phosphatidyltransferase
MQRLHRENFLGKRYHNVEYKGGRITSEKKQISSFLPNFLTLCGMCCGITGIHMALNNNCPFAIFAILMAAFFDGIDGRVARKLGVVSRFGAELDSLSDFATFGIAPAVIAYIFVLNKLGNMGWAIALLFAMSMALRLARFNTNSINGVHQPWMCGLATGVPAPAGAYMLLWPLMVDLWLNIGVNAVVFGGWAVFIAGLTISRIPTFLLKSKKNTVPQKFVSASLLAVVAILGMAYSYPWFTLVSVGVLYLCSIFFSVKLFRKEREKFFTEKEGHTTLQ